MARKIEVKDVTSKKEWEDFIKSREEANFLQSWTWGQFQKDERPSHYSGFYETGKLIGAMLSIVEPAKRSRYLTVPGGPIIDWHDEELVKVVVEEMRRLGKAEHCVFVRVRPQLLEDSFSANLFEQLGFKSAKMHLHAELTSQLDITKELDQLLSNMRKNTRYELKQAKKKEIKVTESTDSSDIDDFYELQLETARRHGFIPYPKKFLKDQFAAFAKDDQVKLYSANTKDGELIAQAFVIFYGVEAAYHYGASTELGRKEPGAYAIQWQAIKEAKKRGMKRYNFWGVVEPYEEDHRFFGVSVFKRGFRGNDVRYLHAHDLVINKPKYAVNWSIEAARKAKRKV